MNESALPSETQAISDIWKTQRSLPKREKSKSLNNLDKRIVKYELLAHELHEHLRQILRYGVSETLLNDYEFVISALTLMKLNIYPRNAKHLKEIYIRYKDINI